jgi:hypothetical protein
MSRETFWTDDRLTDLRRMADLGMSSTEIAAELHPDLTRNAVIGACNRNNIRLGKAVADGARRIANGAIIGWSQAQMDQVVTLYCGGWTIARIAKFVGRGESTVSDKLQTLGIETRRPQRVKPPKPVDATPAPRPIIPVPAPTAWDGQPVALLDAPFNCCRWPVDGPHASPGGWYCGAPMVRRSWCEHHLKLGTTKPSPSHATFKLVRMNGSRAA